MAHIPSTIGCRERSVTAEMSECEPLGEGVWDRLVSLEDDLGDVDNGSEVLNSDIREREFLSQWETLPLPGFVSRTLVGLAGKKLDMT